MAGAAICGDGVAGELKIGRGRAVEDVWEVSGVGVDLFSQEGWPFIGQRGGMGGWPGAAKHHGLG
jgi:hypothetical protein